MCLIHSPLLLQCRRQSLYPQTFVPIVRLVSFAFTMIITLAIEQLHKRYTNAILIIIKRRVNFTYFFRTARKYTRTVTACVRQSIRKIFFHTVAYTFVCIEYFNVGDEKCAATRFVNQKLNRSNVRRMGGEVFTREFVHDEYDLF